MRIDLLNLMGTLDSGATMHGPLSADARARLFAVLDTPTQQTWEDAHTINLIRHTTLWQAVLMHTEYRVTSKPADGPWPDLPTSVEILYALHAELGVPLTRKNPGFDR